MDLFSDAATTEIKKRTKEIVELLESLSDEERIDALNEIRIELHKTSPFVNEPVDCVIWVKSDRVQGNDYNPNRVAPPEMRLLEHSIEADGYTQPIVGAPVDDGFKVVDGYHRMRVGKESSVVRERVSGYLPITQVRTGRTANDLMAATIRHNRARGVHGVQPMTHIIAEAIRLGWDDDRIRKELGMDADEVLRFKQNSGIADLFKNNEYSPAWE